MWPSSHCCWPLPVMRDSVPGGSADADDGPSLRLVLHSTAFIIKIPQRASVGCLFVCLPCAPDILLLPAAAPDPCLCNTKTDTQRINIGSFCVFTFKLGSLSADISQRRLRTCALNENDWKFKRCLWNFHKISCMARQRLQPLPGRNRPC